MRNLRWLILLLIFVTHPLLAQLKFYENGNPTHRGSDGGIFLDTPTRAKIDLAGPWRYSLDGREWFPVLVPSSYDGTARVVFRRTFNVPEEMLEGYAFSLVAYGINYEAEISINGVFVGRHTGGHTTFVLPIADNILQIGTENVITVSVHNELTPRTTLPLRQPVWGMRSYGGIIRDIYLLATPRLFVSDIQVLSELSPDFKHARLRVRATVENQNYRPAAEVTTHALTVEVYDKLTEALVARSHPVPFSSEPRRSVEAAADVAAANIKTWSPDTPDLYVVRCNIIATVGRESVLVDQYAINYGFRDVKFENDRILVNGVRTPLKGIVWKEDHPLFGSALTYEELEKDVVQLKGTGANLVRFLHPPHPYMLNLFARYGLFAMIEVPLAGVPEQILSTDHYEQLVGNYVREMVLRDRNHAAVLAWGVGDDIDPGWKSARPCKFIASNRELVKSIDGRPVYYISRFVDDPCLDELSLVVVNIPQNDIKQFREHVREWQARHSATPLVVARIGRDVEPGNRNGYSDPLSEEAQSRHIMQFLDVVKETQLAGGIVWTYNDWLGDRPALSSRSGNPYLHAMGIVNRDREKRLAYSVLGSSFRGEKIAALPVGTYSPSAPIIFVLAGLVALIAFAFMYNSNRRFRENINRSLTRTYNFFADVRDQRILATSHSIFLAFVLAVTLATIFCSILVYYQDNLPLDNLLGQILGDGLKEQFVFLVWEPARFILVFSGIVLIGLLVLAGLVKLASLLARSRVRTYHAVSVAIWSFLPLVGLIPLAMILFRVMETPEYILPSFVVIGILSLWSILRLLKGVSIIYDVFPFKVYAIGILVILGGLALVYGYLDYTQSATTHLRHTLRTQAPISQLVSTDVR